MPLVAEAIFPQSTPSRGAARLGFAAGSLLLTGAAILVVAWAADLAPFAPHAPRSPFSIGVQEAPPAGVVGTFILQRQAQLYAAMTAAVRQASFDSIAGWPLLALCFCYGILHAAGPGHGKAVISSFLLADRPAIRIGLLLCAAAAAVQALVAIGIVGILAVVLHMTAAAITRSTSLIERASFCAIVLYGAWLTWTKAGGIRLRRAVSAPGHAAHGWSGCQLCGCSLAFAAHPGQRPRTGTGFAAAALAAGLRPCSGAIIVLVFALSQGVGALGVLAVGAMAAGTACTTVLCASAALFARRWALRLTARRDDRAANLLPLLETALGGCVVWLGLILLCNTP